MGGTLTQQDVLEFLIERKGWGQADFAKKLGYTSPAAVNKWFSRNPETFRPMRRKSMQKVERAMRLPPGFLSRKWSNLEQLTEWADGYFESRSEGDSFEAKVKHGEAHMRAGARAGASFAVTVRRNPLAQLEAQIQLLVKLADEYIENEQVGLAAACWEAAQILRWTHTKATGQLPKALSFQDFDIESAVLAKKSLGALLMGLIGDRMLKDPESNLSYHEVVQKVLEILNMPELFEEFSTPPAEEIVGDSEPDIPDNDGDDQADESAG